MGGNAVFRVLMHLGGADLHLQRLAIVPDHRRVQGLVEIVLRRGNVIIELPRDGSPARVDEPESRIARADVGDDQTNGPHVAHELERLALFLHLLVDGIDVLGAPANLQLDIVLLKQHLQALNNGFYLCFAIRAALCQLPGDFLIFGRVDVTERQVFELPLDLPDTEPVRQWCENIQGLLGDALALRLGHVAERAHVVQAVCQLDQHHAHIVTHGEEGLAQGFRREIGTAPENLRLRLHLRAVAARYGVRMLIVAGDARQVRELGNAVHERGHAISEVPPKVIQRDGGIFHRIVQQSGGEHLRRHAQLGQDLGHGKAVIDIWLAGDAGLAAMGFLCHPVGALN